MNEQRKTVDPDTLRETLEAVGVLLDLVRKSGMKRLWPWSDWPDDLESFEERLREALRERESGKHE